MRRIVGALGLDLLVLAGFVAVLAVLWAIFGTATLSLGHSSTAMPPIVMSALVAAPLFGRLRGAPRRALAVHTAATLRDWLPLGFMLVVYDNFHDLTRIVRPDTVDALLERWDVTLFGVEPSLALQPLVRPWLTEWMSFAYATLFVWMMILLTLVYVRGDLERFREIGLAFGLAFYLGLVGYMLVPAIGPRYAFAERFVVPLEGGWLTQHTAAAWRSYERIDRDCFPSLHTALSSISLVYLWRCRRLTSRWLFAIAVPIIASLWLSTLYLRYHYGVDVLSGWALAGLCVTVAPALTRWYRRWVC